MSRGPLVILSGPSGCGKSTVVGRLLAHFGPRLRLAVSATTRGRRPAEEDGVHYHFWTSGRFDEEKARDGFLEWAEVHGNKYGTPRSEVEPHLNRGTGVLLDIDVQGAAQVKAGGRGDLSVFLRTSTLEVLEQRLRGRRTESEEAIRRRLANAERELLHAAEYDHQVVNDDLERCVAEVTGLIEAVFRRSGTCSTN